jgi:hypothetical protein
MSFSIQPEAVNESLACSFDAKRCESCSQQLLALPASEQDVSGIGAESLSRISVATRPTIKERSDRGPLQCVL